MAEQGELGVARTRRRVQCAVVLVAAIVLVAACGDDGAPSATDGTTAPVATDAATAATGTDAATSLAGTSWTLASLDVDGDEVAAVGTPTLAFAADGTALTGSTGCNQFAGTYSQTGSELTLSLGPMTLVACVDPAASDQEAALVASLPEVVSFTATDQLVLLDADGAPLLTYEPGLSSLEGTSWTATGINNGRGGLESTVATGTVTADFGAGGTLSGFAGCNRYHAAYALSGDDGISITGVATTRMACPDDVMALEAQYVAALGAATTYAISGDSLTLRDDDGAMQVTYVLAS